MGIQWILTNRALKVGSVRSVPIWSKKNIVAGFWQDVTGRAWNDSSARELPHVEVSARVDVVRLQDKGVHVIECEET